MTRSIVYGASIDIDMGNNKLTNLADGVAADDAATVGQISGGSGIPTDGWISSSGWSYSSADSPTFVIATSSDLSGTIPVGARVKLTQTTAKYFIVTAIDSTTITVYGGTDYTLANATITSPYWSPVKVPFGFPADPNKWTVETTATGDYQKSSPTNNTWYGDTALTSTGPSIVVPIGSWRLYYEARIYVFNSGSDTFVNVAVTLSTASNTESDGAFTAWAALGDANNAGKQVDLTVHREKVVTLASKSTRYLNLLVNSGGTLVGMGNSQQTMVIRAVCAYL